jgi:hypothetical protein
MPECLEHLAGTEHRLRLVAVPVTITVAIAGSFAYSFWGFRAVSILRFAFAQVSAFSTGQFSSSLNARIQAVQYIPGSGIGKCIESEERNPDEKTQRQRGLAVPGYLALRA